MPKKLTFEYVKNFIDKENELISKMYINNKELLSIKCKKCNEIYNQCFSSYHMGYRHQFCGDKDDYFKKIGKKGGISSSAKRYGNSIPIKETIRICEWCKQNYNPKRSEQKFCNRKCSILSLVSDKEKLKINGRKGFNKRQTHKRSKNEILFSELCISHFGEIDIQCNEQIFKDKNGNFWDCDIFIKSLKIAILWDGWYWHYSPNISNRQKARDVLKRKIILDNGYKYYTIIDKGKFNKSFVEYEFYLFLHKVQFKSSLDQVEKKVNLNRDFL